MALLWLPETRPAVAPRAGEYARSGFARLATAFRHPELAPLLAVGFVVVTGFAAFEVTFAQFVHARLDLPHGQVAFLFVYVGVMAAIVQGGLVGRLSRRLGERRLLLAALLAIAAGLVALAPAHNLTRVLLVLPLLSLGAGLTTPTLTALVSRAAHASEQGLALGAFQGVSSLGRVIGPFAAEIALGRWGVAAPQLGAAVLALAAAGGAAALLRRPA
jgi:predicted MFS family arabinose efflux permease